MSIFSSAVEQLSRFLSLVQLRRERRRDRIIFLFFAGDVAVQALEVGAAHEPSAEKIRFERLQEFERPAHTDAEGIDARLEALQVARLEDADERLLASGLEVVAPGVPPS